MHTSVSMAVCVCVRIYVISCGGVASARWVPSGTRGGEHGPGTKRVLKSNKIKNIIES